MLTHYFFCFCLPISLRLRFRVVLVGWSWRRRWKPAPVPMTTTPGAAHGTPAVGAGRCCTAWATTTQLTAVSAPLELLYNSRLQRCVFGGGCCRVIKTERCISHWSLHLILQSQTYCLCLSKTTFSLPTISSGENAWRQQVRCGFDCMQYGNCFACLQYDCHYSV